MTLLGSESDCDRAIGMASRLADRDLSAEESVWLDSHIKRCAGCAATLAQFAEIESGLRGLGQTMTRSHLASVNARSRLAARMRSDTLAHRGTRLALALAAAIGAATVILLSVPTRPEPAVVRGERPFVAIPYLAPLDPQENTEVVRMNIPVETLLAMGYCISEEPDNAVPADVLIGEDGRAHAVRPLSDIELAGRGD
jgi:hypothetical protein